MTVANKCPLCQTPAESREIDISRGISEWQCRRCGHFIKPYGDPRSHEHLANRLHLISGLAREMSERGQTLNIPGWKPNEIDELLSARVPTTVQEKADKLLQAIARKSKGIPGTWVRIDPLTDYPWAYARDSREFICFVKHLEESKLIETVTGQGDEVLTVKGWQRVEKLKESRATSTKAFVAMWFKKGDEELKALRKVIKKAVEAAGYAPVIVDEEPHIDKIDDYITVCIREARFMVADFTGHRPNVYYEAGFARGLGMRVISLCHEDHIEKDEQKGSIGLQFDTQQYKHIPWTNETLDEVQQKLLWHIIENFGRGPVKSTAES